MTILGHDTVIVRKEGDQLRWLVLEPYTQNTLYAVGFQWAWNPLWEQSTDFQTAVNVCLQLFPLDEVDKEQIYKRFPSLRGTPVRQVDYSAVLGIEYEEKQSVPTISNNQKELPKTQEKVIKKGRKLIL
jgi:hypothetical protein